MSPAEQAAALAQLRARLRKLESDERLLQTEREEIRMRVLGVLNVHPRTAGEAKRLAAAYEHAIAHVTLEIPF